MSDDKKVFCGNCKHFESDGIEIIGITESGNCKHSSNIRIFENWYGRRELFQNSPNNLNELNDCKNWESKK